MRVVPSLSVVVLAVATITALRAQAPEPAPLSRVQVASSGTHTLIVGPDGTVYGFGRNQYGQAGAGSQPYIAEPTALRDVPPARQVSIANADRSVLLSQDGRVYTWGRNEYGTLGVSENDVSERTSPGEVAGLTGVVRLASCRRAEAALREDGTVWMWGQETQGVLGRGATGARLDDSVSYTFPIPAQVVGLSAVTEIACGAGHMLALQADGTVWSWGSNRRGQLGLGDDEPRGTPVRVSLPSAATAIGAVDEGSWARLADGTWRMWGWVTPVKAPGDYPPPVPSPMAVPGALGAAVEISDSIARLADGTVRTFGTNPFGSLGTGQGPDAVSMRGVLVKSLAGVVRVWGGNNRMFALLSDGRLMGWGSIHQDRDARTPELIWKVPAS
jgi:alpha-tubulin suppressor-like RCC1 family protein